MYKYIVGKGGVSPEYFFLKMHMWEAMLYLEGMQLRDRSIYDAMRILVANVLSGMGAKKKDGTAIRLSEIYQFPDEVETDAIETEEDIEKKKQNLISLLRSCNAENKKAASK